MITIKDKKGLITLKGQHCVWFNPEKGMWKIHIKMISGDIRESFEKTDRIMIINPHFFRKSEFEYDILS